jgi:hypothetical protein
MTTIPTHIFKQICGYCGDNYKDAHKKQWSQLIPEENPINLNYHLMIVYINRSLEFSEMIFSMDNGVIDWTMTVLGKNYDRCECDDCPMCLKKIFGILTNTQLT